MQMLAKLCSGLHKPDDQTVLPPPEAAVFVAPLPLRALPGIGGRLVPLPLRALPGTGGFKNGSWLGGSRWCFTGAGWLGSVHSRSATWLRLGHVRAEVCGTCWW